MPNAFLHVHTRALAGRDDDFDRWYDDVHIPQILKRVPGVVDAHRHRLAASQPSPPESVPARPHLTIYTIEGDPETVVADLGSAFGDGRLDGTDTLDPAFGPAMTLYVPRD